MENALGWSSFSGTNSATMVRMMPTAILLETDPMRSREGEDTVAISSPHDGPDRDGHGKTRRHTPGQKTNHGADETDQDDGLPTYPVRGLAPWHGCDALRDGEDGSREARPFCDILPVHAEALDHLGEVGEYRCQRQGLGEPGHGYMYSQLCNGRGYVPGCLQRRGMIWMTSQDEAEQWLT